MSTPIKELIAVNIETAINEITVVGGFNQDLTAIRPKREDFKDTAPNDLTVLIVQGDPEVPEDAAIGTGTWALPFAIMAIVLDSDAASTSIDTRLNQVSADIEKKLMEDFTRGGYAFDTQILPSIGFDDGKGFSGVAVRVAVHYRTEINNPYTKA